MYCKLYHYGAHVVSVYDGDTIRVDIDLGCNVWIKNEPLRLYGINAPEVRGPQRSDGLLSAQYLRDMINGKDIFIESIKDKKGKYGRYLAKIWLENEDKTWLDVNQKLINDGFAEAKFYR